MRVLGVDPGFAHMGVAVVDEHRNVVDAFVVGTKKTSNKARRVTDDDVDRMNLLWLNINQAVIDHQPEAVGVETYTVFKPGQGGHGKGAGWKAVFAYAMTCSVAFSYKIPVYAFRPTDLKQKVAGWTSAGKQDIEDAVRRSVGGAAEALDRIPASAREHAADAIGHALLTLERHRG